MSYLVKNLDAVTHYWGLIAIAPNTGEYNFNIGDITSEQAILTFPQYGENTELIRLDKLEIYHNGGLLGAPENTNFATNYFNNPYDAIGVGDMLKEVYDTDKDGIVDDSELLGGQVPSYYATSADLSGKEDSLGDPSTDDEILTSLANGTRSWIDRSVLKGDTGAQGEQGIPGTSGTDGIQGEKGDQGIQGTSGIDGSQGPKGDDGEPINWLGEFNSAPSSPVYLDAYFNTVDGQAYIWGNPGQWDKLSQKGADGTSVEIKGSDTYDNIIVNATATEGDLWISTTDGLTHTPPVSVGDGLVSNGLGAGDTNWNNIGPIQGPQGEPGEKGDTGDQGIQGTSGTDGIDGSQGIQGIQGEKGDKGDQGDTGLPGTTLHANLTDTASNGHPISAIVDLQTSLDDKEDDLGTQTIDGQVLASSGSDMRYWIDIPSAPVTSVNTQTGVVVLDTDDISEGTNKYYPDSDKTKLAGIAAGAEVNVNADWDATSGDAEILNKPTIPPVQTYLHADLSDTSTDGHPITAITNLQTELNDKLDIFSPEFGNAGQVLTTTSGVDGYEWTDKAVSGGGDMLKSTYDTDDSGVVDNAETVTGHTVETNVPMGAVFTDTTYTDAEIKSKYEANADTNAFDDAEKLKLAQIEAGAEVNVQSDWNQGDIGLDDFIKNKPTIPPVQTYLHSQLTDTDTDGHPISAIDGLQTSLDGKEPANANIQAHISDVANPHSTNFINLTDTDPTDYVGFSGYRVTVKDDESGLLFEKSSGTGTTAGILDRIYYTGDVENWNGDDYYITNRNNKGTVADATQTIICGDNTKLYFGQDALGTIAVADNTVSFGTYDGQLTCQSSVNGGEQKFTIEIYLVDPDGSIVDPGVTPVVVGDLGNALVIADSGKVDMQSGNETQINANAYLTQDVAVTVGQRFRYHMSGEKIGTAGGNATLSLHYGSDFNSFMSVPSPVTTDSVINASTVAGGTATNALDILNSGKANKVSGATVNDIVVFDANGDMADSGYKKDDNGVTADDLWSASKIQTQIDAGGSKVGGKLHVGGNSGEWIARNMSLNNAGGDESFILAGGNIGFVVDVDKDVLISHDPIQPLGVATKQYVDALPTAPVTSVNGEVGVVVLDKSHIGLGNVDNTSDGNKPVSSATQSALDLKADDTDLISHTTDTNNPHGVNPAQVGNGTAQWNANKLQTIDIDTTTPATGQHLIYTGGKWTPITYTPPAPTITLSKAITVMAPEATDSIIMWITDVAITITNVTYATKGGIDETVDFNINASTDIWATDKQATTGLTSSTPDGGSHAVVANSEIIYNASAIGGTNNQVNVTISYTLD